jgi:hypothetical protein
MAIGRSGGISQSTCEKFCVFPEEREGVLERGDDALYDPYHDGPKVGSRKHRDEVGK